MHATCKQSGPLPPCLLCYALKAAISFEKCSVGIAGGCGFDSARCIQPLTGLIYLRRYSSLLCNMYCFYRAMLAQSAVMR